MTTTEPVLPAALVTRGPDFNGWTHETLKAYFEVILHERDRALSAALAAQKLAVEAALAAADRAVAKAEISAEKRFESVNEFRAQLKDQQVGLISRAEADARFAAISDRSDAERSALRDRVNRIQERLDKSEGQGVGLHQGWVVLLGAVGFVGGILGIIGGLAALLK